MGELEFRDGKRLVPDYMDELMVGLPLRKLTYEQAIAAMNQVATTNIIERAFDRIIDRHFEENRQQWD